MPVTEESRHRLHQALDRTIGDEEATTLMEHLPPVGWVDIATKQDIALVRSDIEGLEVRMTTGFEAVDQRFETMDARMTTGFEAVDQRFETMDARMTTGFEAVDQRFETMDARMAAGFEVLEASIAKVGRDIADMGKRIDDSDRRYEALTARVDSFLWHVIALLGTIGVILIGVAQVRGR